jgi:hypothetical protein
MTGLETGLLTSDWVQLETVLLYISHAHKMMAYLV